MTEKAIQRNDDELKTIMAIADGGNDQPVVMLNLNRYAPDAGYADGDLYRSYMSALGELLPHVGGEILWRTPVFGQAVGEQKLDEILAAWYPSHRSFLDLPKAPGAEENFRLRALCIEYAVIHRCLGDRAPLKPE